MRKALDSLDELRTVREDALLVASELVTNAVLHSGCTPDQSIEVRAMIEADRLVISVHDPGVRGEGPRLRIGEGHRGGFGLRLVELVARRWGWEREGGHRVWAEVSLH